MSFSLLEATPVAEMGRNPGQSATGVASYSLYFEKLIWLKWV
jgi:hypothetical protein